MRGLNLAEEKKKFVLYENLLYFWKRKWFFVIVPLITTILIAGTVYALKHDKKFTGVALVSTGSVDSKELTDPTSIGAKFKDIKDLSDVFVSEKGQVKFTINGKSRDAVSKDIDQITTRYNKELQNYAKKKLGVSIPYLSALDERVKFLKDSIAMYNKKLDQGNLTTNQFDEVNTLINTSLDAQTFSAERANKIRADVDLFENPKVLSVTVGPKKTYIPESIAIGIILGLVLTVALLMLLKYLGDARRYYKHD
jgi:uncharacterized protein involved in exopolysaccharide biosynthesis